MIVVLDSGVLGLLSSPKATDANRACNTWLADHLVAGTQVVLPEIVDYETRRAYLHRRMARYTRRLDDLHDILFYQPLSTEAMRLAAELWAEARRSGRKTAPDHALDIDVILCAQARLLQAPEAAVVVATTNVKHLAPFVSAARWESIRPSDG